MPSGTSWPAKQHSDASRPAPLVVASSLVPAQVGPGILTSHARGSVAWLLLAWPGGCLHGEGFWEPVVSSGVWLIDDLVGCPWPRLRGPSATVEVLYGLGYNCSDHGQSSYKTKAESVPTKWGKMAGSG